MYLAKIEIVKGELNEITTEKIKLVVFDRNDGLPFMKISIKDIENRYVIISTFSWHGDTYMLVTEK